LVVKYSGFRIRNDPDIFKSFKMEGVMNSNGYSGNILKIDLSNNHISNLDTGDYVDRFLGGRGLAARLYWDNVLPATGALDPDNMLIFTTGPLAGFTHLGGSRWQICGKSPAMEPQYFSHANLGGSWGAFLKFSGYDAIAVHGRAEKPVYIYVHDGEVEIRDAGFIWGKTAKETREILKEELGKGVRVAATGPAGENLVTFATVLADDDSNGSSGFGAVMGSKRLKAIAVAGDKKPVAARPQDLEDVVEHLSLLRGDAGKRPHPWVHPGYTQKNICYGCVAGCARQRYKTSDNKKVKFFCQPGDMYQDAVIKYYGEWNEVVVQAVELCHTYGLDTFVLEPMMAWLDKCYKAGILNDKDTGLPLSRMGSAEFIETLVKKISFRKDFGDVLARGTLAAASAVGNGSEELIGDSISTRANDMSMYDPRLYIVTGLLYATEPRKPIQQLHDISNTMLEWEVTAPVKMPGQIKGKDFGDIGERFWGSRAAGNMSMSEGKALAAKIIQDRNYAKESLILCDFLFPVIWTHGHVGDPDVESRILSAVIGKDIDESGLNHMGERVCNLHRAIRLREGWPGQQGDTLRDVFFNTPVESVRFNPDCLVPGTEGEPVSRRGSAVDRSQFEALKKEYYNLRGWDQTSGLLTRSGMHALELDDVADDLENRGLLR
jgi:aldehyde:ferredoxin oxidoreductase